MKKSLKSPKTIVFGIPGHLPYAGMPRWRLIYNRHRPPHADRLLKKLHDIQCWIRENGKQLGVKAVALGRKADYVARKLKERDLDEAEFLIGHLWNLILVQIPADRDRKMMSARRGRRRDYLRGLLEDFIQKNPKAKPKIILQFLESRVAYERDNSKNAIEEVHEDGRISWLDQRGRQRDTSYRTLQNQISKIKRGTAGPPWSPEDEAEGGQ